MQYALSVAVGKPNVNYCQYVKIPHPYTEYILIKVLNVENIEQN
jgi:hypothetical protein